MATRKKMTTVILRVRTSFDGFRQGEEHEAVVDSVVQGWLNAGVVEVIGGGEDPAGPSSVAEDVPGGEPE